MIKKEQAKDSPLERYKVKESVEELTQKAIELTSEDSVKFALRYLIRKRENEMNLEAYKKKLTAAPEQSKFTTAQLFEYFKIRFVEIENRPFVSDAFCAPVVKALCLYFNDDKKFESLNESYSLQKGVLIFGNVGCGKTSLLRAFTQNQKQSFRFVSTRKIVNDYSEGGFNAVKKYMIPGVNGTSSQCFAQREIGWMFDDLGFEKEARHYGNKSNIVSELIHSLYENTYMRGRIHATTNMNGEALKDFYGNRISSRMREMFNIITYDSKAPDRRV